jgi:hypothetical protein
MADFAREEVAELQTPIHVRVLALFVRQNAVQPVTLATGLRIDEMKWLGNLTWSHRAPPGMHAVNAANRKPAMEYVGIDVHKNQSQICLLTETGEVLHQRIHTQRERLREAQGGWHQ